jgi:hypothetical protein
MTEQEAADIITAEWKKLSRGHIEFAVRYVRPNQPFQPPPIVLKATDSGGLHISEIVLIDINSPPEQKLASFYHEVGHLFYSWTRIERSSSSPWEDELYAYRYMFQRLIDEKRFQILAQQIQRMERMVVGKGPQEAHYIKAMQTLTTSEDWKKWKGLCAQAS